MINSLLFEIKNHSVSIKANVKSLVSFFNSSTLNFIYFIILHIRGCAFTYSPVILQSLNSKIKYKPTKT